MRLLGQIGGYIWDCRQGNGQETTVIAHLFAASTFHLPLKDAKTSIAQKTQWPWEDKVDFSIDGSTQFALKIRIPAWAAPDYRMEPKCPHAEVKNGYLSIPPTWLESHKTFSLTLPIKPRWVAPPIQTGQDIVALARGPVIYCVEDYDNDWVRDHFKVSSPSHICLSSRSMLLNVITANFRRSSHAC
jgi:hypothetical protein